jgi:hypothetical protein
MSTTLKVLLKFCAVGPLHFTTAALYRMSISRKKSPAVGWALAQRLTPAVDNQSLGRHRGQDHLISHDVLCGMSIAK